MSYGIHYCVRGINGERFIDQLVEPLHNAGIKVRKLIRYNDTKRVPLREIGWLSGKENTTMQGQYQAGGADHTRNKAVPVTNQR